MDPHAHSELMKNSGDKPRTVYINQRIDGVRLFTSRYADDRSTSNTKGCGCSNASGNSECNECRSVTPEVCWTDTRHTHASDFENVGNRKSYRQNAMCKNPTISHASYCHENDTRLIDEPIIRNKTIIATSIETKTSNRQQNAQATLQIINPKHADVIGSVQELLYDNIYSNNQEPRHPMETKFNYIPPVSAETTLYNIDTHMNQSSIGAIRSVNKDRHKIVNIGNILNVNDRNPNSSFTPKYSTVFHPEQRNATHYDLYMPTPQFSTNNFTPLEPQQSGQRDFNQDFTNTDTTSRVHIYADNSNVNELQMSSDLPYTHQKHFNHVNESQYPGQIREAIYGNVKATQMDNINYCSEGSSDVHVSEMHTKYAPQLYEYMKNPTPPHFVADKIKNIGINNYKEQEIGVYRNQEINNLQKTKYNNFYNKPYVSQPSSENYKKSIYSMEQSNLRKELPPCYQKFDNVSLNREIQLNKVVQIANDNSQTSNRTPLMSCKTQESFSYDIPNAHNLSSAAFAVAAASKHRSFRINAEYNASHNTQLIEYQNQQIKQVKDSSSSLNSLEAMHGKRDVYDYRNIYRNSKMACFNTNKIQSLNVQVNSTQPASISNQKKTHIPKPNYREMMYALRNSTNEDELNLKIIKKTLNVDPQVLRTSSGPVANVVAPAVTKMHSNLIISTESLNPITLNKSCYVYDNYSAERPSTPFQNTVVNTSYDKKQLNECTVKTEEKSNTFPLDLSIRTIKTKADSTEYKRQSYLLNIPQNIACKSALPKVDFTPNFSLHTKDDNAISNVRINDNKNLMNVSPHLQRPLAHFKEFNSTSIPKFQSTSPEFSQTTHQRITYESTSTTNVDHTPAALNSRTKLQDPLKSQDIKSATKNIPLPRNTDILQIRRSVLEANPYATNKIQNTTKEFNTFTVDHLPPETSIMPLSKIGTHSNKTLNVTCKELSASVKEPYSLMQNTSVISKNSTVEIVDRKRNLREFSNIKFSEVHPKKGRYTEPTQTSDYNDVIDNNKVSVIERGLDIEPVKTAEKSIQAEIFVSCYKKNDFDSIIKDETKHICNNEVTFLACPAAISTPTLKPEIVASRIRTKAELKGFTFNSPIIQNTLTKEIKEEPLEYQTISTSSKNIPALLEEYIPLNLLDVNWSSACNNFVEQLKNRQLSNIDETAKFNLQNNSNYSDVTTQINQYESINNNLVESTIFLNDKTIAKSKKALTATMKPIDKLDREKLILQQKQRIVARLDDESSSDTGNEFSDVKCERFNKKLRKGRIRRSKTSIDRSDCVSDSSSDLGKTLGFPNQSEKSLCKKDREQEKCIKNILKDDSEMLKNNDSQFDSTKALIENDVNVKNNHNNIKSKNVITDRDKLKNEVQYDKSTRQPKYISKISLHAMTRSKRKKELELQLANSKVLRNDKIIRNSTTKIKRKYVRKFVTQQNSYKDSFTQELKGDSMSTRLRSKFKNNTLVVKTNVNNKKSANNNIGKNIKSLSTNRNGKEKRDFLMEVYRYKRSLKIPPSLITIKPPGNHKTTTSLPNLEKDNCDMPSNDNLCLSGKNFTSFTPNLKHISIGDRKLDNQIHSEHKSIIDVLHSRVINSSSTHPRLKNFKSKNIQNDFCTGNTKNVFCNKFDKFIQIKEGECEEDKKRHFSIFETQILQSKTRTESRLQQKRENIREIFVGNDRPASAPPEITQASDCLEHITYEQKYEQFLQQINEDSLRNFGRTNIFDVSFLPRVKVKREDAESNGAIDMEEKIDSENQSKLLSNCSFHRSYKRRRPGKYVRRRGSSGFDYIRKKKKSNPSSLSSIGHNNNLSLKSNIYDIGYLNKIKSEDDVCREIQKWVLNKGVGQSTLHKAARLGYIDVIVYCLDRMCINPDQKDNAGYTPLHEACTNGWLQIARVLLQYGANHSEAAHSGIRPLHEASENDHEEIVRLLLSYGADPMVATYSGQTPLTLASSTAMINIFNNYLSDMHTSEPGKPWNFNGPWEIFDPAECGYDVMGEAPNYTCDMSRALRKNSLSNLITNKNTSVNEKTNSKSIIEKCAVVLDNIDRFNCIRLHNDNKPEFLVENSDSEGEIFEFEEADILLPPLYLLKNEGSDKWILLNDLCNLLKVKSKDTLLNKICPSSSASSSRNLTRELKMADFLEKATCLQLLCAGEKINICASKVVLIKYSESVRNLLGVKTILMKF